MVAAVAPTVEAVAGGGWRVSVTGSWGSFYRGEWFPGSVVLDVESDGLSADPGSLVIEMGRAAINRTQVDVTARGPAGATEMRIANGSDPSGAGWVALTDTIPWELEAGDGIKTVSAQFRGPAGVSDVAEASIVLDTVAPVVTIESHREGDIVAGSDGSVVAVDGSATDDRSGVEQVVFDDGESDPRVAGVESGVWTAPVSPVTSGPGVYQATATDVAGNEATTQAAVVLEAPPGTGTLLRPGVLEVDAGLAADLRSVSADGSSVVFAGDKSALLDRRTVLVASGLSDGPTKGLLHRVLSYSYDAGTDETRVVTEFGSILDVFARLEPPEPTPAPAQLRGSVVGDDPVGPAACDAFKQNRTLALSVDLPPVTVIHPDGNARGELDLEGVVVADSSLRISGLSLSGKITGGFMVCGDSTTENNDELGSPVTFYQGPTVSIGDTLKESLEAIKIPIGGPVYLTPELGADLAPVIDLAAASLEETGFNVGVEAGLKLGSGPIPEFIFDNIVNSETRALRPGSGASEWGASLTMTFGFTVNEIVSTDLLSGGLKLTRRTTPEWVGTPGQPGAYITKVTFGICATPIFKIGLTLDVGFKKKVAGFEVGFSVRVIDVGKDFELAPLCPQGLQSETIASTTPPTISTESLPGGEVGTPYLKSLESSDPYVTWDITGLPDGLAPTGGGAIEGTPTQPGTSNITVTARGLSGRTTTEILPLTVRDRFRILTQSLPELVVGQPYEAQLEANEPATWELTGGTLPDGLSMSTNGLISGEPASGDSATITVKATASDGRTTTRRLDFFSVLPVVAGTAFRCQIVAGGDVYCAGRNDHGQLGNGTFDRSQVVDGAVVASRVLGVSDAVDLVGGDRHVCVLESGGDVKCWGDTEGNNAGHPTPFAADLSDRATQVDTTSRSGSLTCARLANATVECWGYQGYDPFYYEIPSQEELDTPTRIASFDGAQQVAVGGGHACALMSNGDVFCSGHNYVGETGSSDLTPFEEFYSIFDPANQVALPSDVVSITAGSDTNCALTESQEVWCWGDNHNGRLGTGDSTIEYSPTPLKVEGLVNSPSPLSIGLPVQVESYAGYSCVVSTRNRIGCWGSNFQNVLVGPSPFGGDIHTVDPPIVMTEDGYPVSGATVINDADRLHHGDHHACAARRTEDSSWCWWNNPWLLEFALGG